MRVQRDRQGCASTALPPPRATHGVLCVVPGESRVSHRGALCHAGDPHIAQGCLLCHRMEGSEGRGGGCYGAARFNEFTGSLGLRWVAQKRGGQTFRGPMLQRIFFSKIIPSSKTNHAALQGVAARPCPGVRPPR